MSEITELKRVIEAHTRDDVEQFKAIHGALTIIKDNHLEHIQEAVTTIATEIKEIKVDLKANTKDTQEAKSNINWVMKIGGTVGSVLLVAIIGLLFEVIRRGGL